jgi:hypothetical protein
MANQRAATAPSADAASLLPTALSLCLPALQGVACALQGQATGSLEQLRAAQESFAAVGTSPTEQDTVPGRQCMASALLLGGQPGEALPYLESIAEVCGVGEDDSLSWNLGAARAACGQWAAAAEALQAVQVRGKGRQLAGGCAPYVPTAQLCRPADGDAACP